MKSYKIENTNDFVYSDELDNGLNVYLIPNSKFNNIYATFTTKFGGKDLLRFGGSGNNAYPAGIAHFLEHKLFEQNNKDVATLFAANQARVNASTQNNRTTYMFSCTDNLESNIELLLNFVQNPLFTEKGVEKEKGIITQEIRMYQDDPGTIAYMHLLKNMYENHPVQYDILGTEDSIKDINADILSKAHQTFYNPKNMILFVAGNFIAEELIQFIRRNQNNITFNNKCKNASIIPTQDNIIHNKKTEINLEINIPNYLNRLLNIRL